MLKNVAFHNNKVQQHTNSIITSYVLIEFEIISYFNYKTSNSSHKLIFNFD